MLRTYIRWKSTDISCVKKLISTALQEFSYGTTFPRTVAQIVEMPPLGVTHISAAIHALSSRRKSKANNHRTTVVTHHSSLIRYQNQKILEFISNLKRKMSYLISESLLIDSISFSQAICLHATSRKQSHYNSLHDEPCYWYNFELASRPILENDMHVLQRFMNFKNNMTLFFHV